MSGAGLWGNLQMPQVLRGQRATGLSPSPAPGAAPIISHLRGVIFPCFLLCLAQQEAAGERSRWEEETEKPEVLRVAVWIAAEPQV